MAAIPPGTSQLRFIPPTGSDTIMKGGISTSISTRHQCVTAMQQYERKSMEELRLEDYWRREFFDWLKKKNARSGYFTEASSQTEKESCNNRFHQGLKEMLLNGKHSDFVLNVKGTEFRVHKVILAAQSPVFAAMFEHDTKERADNAANINDCEPLTIVHFLNFLYAGTVENLTSDKVVDLYEVADKYQVSELISFCVEYMKKNISVENFCEILVVSLRHNVKELTEVAIQFFIRNSTKIAVTPGWQAFIVDNPVAGNELFLKALSLNKE